MFLKKYSAGRMRREKSPDRLICPGVGYNVSPRERTDRGQISRR